VPSEAVLVLLIVIEVLGITRVAESITSTITGTSTSTKRTICRAGVWLTWIMLNHDKEQGGGLVHPGKGDDKRYSREGEGTTDSDKTTESTINRPGHRVAMRNPVGEAVVRRRSATVWCPTRRCSAVVSVIERQVDGRWIRYVQWCSRLDSGECDELCLDDNRFPDGDQAARGTIEEVFP
jgi:hypothetical protein